MASGGRESHRLVGELLFTGGHTSRAEAISPSSPSSSSSSRRVSDSCVAQRERHASQTMRVAVSSASATSLGRRRSILDDDGVIVRLAMLLDRRTANGELESRLRRSAALCTRDAGRDVCEESIRSMARLRAASAAARLLE